MGEWILRQTLGFLICFRLIVEIGNRRMPKTLKCPHMREYALLLRAVGDWGGDIDLILVLADILGISKGICWTGVHSFVREIPTKLAFAIEIKTRSNNLSSLFTRIM